MNLISTFFDQELVPQVLCVSNSLVPEGACADRGVGLYTYL